MTNSEIKPFFINSNLCVDAKDTSSLENFMSAVACNIGNSYPTWSLIKQLQGGFVKPQHIQNIFEYDFSKQDKDIDIINNECTHVFLILQDQIRIEKSYNRILPYDNIINFIKRLNKPIITLSLGANSYNNFDQVTGTLEVKDKFESDFHTKLDPELVNFLRKLSTYNEVMGIRGYYTQEILSKLGINNTQVIGCPSFYEMGRNRIVYKKPFSDNLKVLLANQGNPLDNYSMLPLQHKYNYPAIIQDERKYLNVLFNENFDIDDFNKIETENFFKKKYQCFSDIESWKQYVSTFDFLYGMRIHGSIVALNSGIPSLIMAPDIKGREMAEFMKIPNHPQYINESNIEIIYNACNYDEMNNCYPKLYDDYVGFLHKNGLTIFEEEPSIKYDYTEQPKLELYQNGELSGLINANILLSLKAEVAHIEAEAIRREAEAFRRHEALNSRFDELTLGQGLILKKIYEPTLLQKIFSIFTRVGARILKSLGVRIKGKRKN